MIGGSNYCLSRWNDISSWTEAKWVWLTHPLPFERNILGNGYGNGDAGDGGAEWMEVEVKAVDDMVMGVRDVDYCVRCPCVSDF